MNPDFVTRTARVLTAKGLSLAEHQVMCSAGYRVTLPPLEFVEHAFQAWEGDSRGQSSRTELLAAFEHLQARGFMVCLTEADLREEAARRAISTIPEVFDRGYDVGHVDFTHRGYALYRQVIQEIHGDDFLLSTDAGFNLDTDAGRFDFYAVNAETVDGSWTRFKPTAIPTPAWRPRSLSEEMDRTRSASGGPIGSYSAPPGITESSTTSAAPPNPPR